VNGAVVEIVDPSPSGGYPLVPTRVLINGMDVGPVARHSLSIEAGGDDSMTAVTLTLLPSRLVIRHADPADDVD
jgi:hypothetical protein